jgi:hypothetical protein
MLKLFWKKKRLWYAYECLVSKWSSFKTGSSQTQHNTKTVNNRNNKKSIAMLDLAIKLRIATDWDTLDFRKLENILIDSNRVFYAKRDF